MKTILFLAVLSISNLFVLGEAPSDPKADSLLIIETALNYGEGWYSGDAVRMEKAIHPDLNKVCPVVMPQTGKTFLIYSTWSGLIEMARAKVGLQAESSRKISVRVLKIEENAACARIITSQFNDYLAMVKSDGQWKIVNVLWTFGPDSPSRKPLPDFKGESERPAVEEVVRNMMEGIFQSDPERAGKALHPEYRRASITVMPATGKTMIQRDAASSILEAVRAKVGALPKEKWNYGVNVLDVMDGLAFAELDTPSSVSYLQLAQIEGQWKIINILRRPVAPSQKN